MIRIAICDNSKTIVKKLEKIITNKFNDYTENYEIHLFYNGISLLNQYKLQPYDVIFLGIDMPSLSGFDIVKTIRDLHSDSYIVFVTSNSEHIYKSLDFQPFHFIRTKCEIPLESSANDVITKLIQHIRRFERVTLKNHEGIKFSLYIHEIVYIESDGHYINFHVTSNSAPIIRVRGTLTEYEKKYAEHNFIIIHKQYLVNLKHLTFVDVKRDEVLLGSINKRLTLSRNYKKQINEKHTEYLKLLHKKV